MAGPTTLIHDAVLDLLLCGVTWPVSATTLYLSLHTADPGDTGANEVTASEYQRQAIARSTTAWSGPTDSPSGGRERANNAAITFPSPTSNWGTVTHIGLWDAATGGQLLWVYELASPVSITSGGNPFQIAIGQLRTIHRKGA